MRVLLFGSDGVSAAMLRALMRRGLGKDSLGVVCSPEYTEPIKRGAMSKSVNGRQRGILKSSALDNGIGLSEINRSVDFKMSNWLKEQAAEDEVLRRMVAGKWDLGIVASFGYKVPSSVIEMFPAGVINMHPSLLPKYRGASPISRAIFKGDKVTGISVIELRPSQKIDSGDILLQRSAVSWI